MRMGKGAFAVCLGLALAGPAWAQRTLTFGGVDPARVRNVPLNTSAAIAPLPQGQLTNPGPFRLSSFLPRFFRPGSNILGAPRQAVTTPGGANSDFLKAFQGGGLSQ